MSAAIRASCVLIVRLSTNFNTSLFNDIYRFISLYTTVKLCVCQCSIKNYLLTYLGNDQCISIDRV